MRKKLPTSGTGRHLFSTVSTDRPEISDQKPKTNIRNNFSLTKMDGSGTDSEDAIPRDEQKRRQKAAKEKTELVNKANDLTDAIRHHPEMWLAPELQPLREFVRDISGDPTTFPPATESGTVRSDLPHESLQPTKVLAQKLVNHLDFPEPPRRDECPVIRVGRIEEHQKVSKNAAGIQGEFCQFGMWVMDGDGAFFMV